MTDTCNAFKAVAKSDLTIGRVINSSSNFEISILETANLIAQLMNVELTFVCDKERIRPKDSEVNRLIGDNTLFKRNYRLEASICWEKWARRRFKNHNRLVL